MTRPAHDVEWERRVGRLQRRQKHARFHERGLVAIRVTCAVGGALLLTVGAYLLARAVSPSSIGFVAGVAMTVTGFFAFAWGLTQLARLMWLQILVFVSASVFAWTLLVWLVYGALRLMPGGAELAAAFLPRPDPAAVHAETSVPAQAAAAASQADLGEAADFGSSPPPSAADSTTLVLAGMPAAASGAGAQGGTVGGINPRTLTTWQILLLLPVALWIAAKLVWGRSMEDSRDELEQRIAGLRLQIEQGRTDTPRLTGAMKRLQSGDDASAG